MRPENTRRTRTPSFPASERDADEVTWPRPRPLWGAEGSGNEYAPAQPRESGDMGSRTPDILLAKQALYQLSYVPIASPACAFFARISNFGRSPERSKSQVALAF